MNTLVTTGKSLLNALAFANVNNIDEFRSMLNQIDTLASSLAIPTQRRNVLEESSHSNFTPAIGHAQGAL
jgi:hypothetical protein